MNKEVKCGIYLIRNTINGKVYVGSSISMFARWKYHIYLLNSGKHPNRHLQSAWMKTGKDFFEFMIIECCSDESLIVREKVWVEYYDSMNQDKGYNLICPDRKIITEEMRMKWSKAHFSSSKCLAVDKSHKTDEYRQKISNLHKGNQYNKGRILSEETKRKMSESQRGLLKGNVLSEEHKKKLSVAHMGKITSEATRRILSEKTKAYWSRKHQREGKV
jgi:group I intron endonuclease